MGFDRVGDDEFAELRVFDARARVAGQDTVSDIGGDIMSADLAQGGGGVAECSGGIDDIIDDDADFVADFADNVHHFGLSGFGAALVDDSEVNVESLRDCARAHDSADIGRDDRDFFLREALADVADEDGRGKEVIGRDIEEALDLSGVEVHREDAVGTGIGNHIGDELGRDRRTRSGFAILAGISEIGDDGGDAACRGAAQSVDDNQQFHYVIVGGVGGRLDNEGVSAADVILDFGEDFHIGEAPDIGSCQREAEFGGDCLGEAARAISGDELHG